MAIHASGRQSAVKMSDPFLGDLVALLVAIAGGLIWIMLPGTGLLHLFDVGADRWGRGWQRLGWALLLAFTILPAVDALVARAAGLNAVAGCHAVLALLALRRATWLKPRAEGWRIAAPLLLIWLFIVIFAFVDMKVGGMLNKSMLEYDLVKHAAITSAIAHQNLPFTDPFFARPAAVGYYYYFYLWPAAIQHFGPSFLDGRMAFGAATFWAGLAFPALLWRIGADSGLIRQGHMRRFTALILLFCFLSGADLIAMGFRFLWTGTVTGQSDWWNCEIGFAVHSMLWVPHHMTAVIAAWTAMLLLVRVGERDATARWPLAVAAGLGIATCFGSSVWIMLTIAPVLTIWGAISLFRRDMTLLLAGIVALLGASIQIADLLAFRDDGALPIAFAIRPFALFFPDGGDGALFNLALLPLNYAAEFGIFAWGAIMWWKRDLRWPRHPVQILLLASALFSLLISSFLKSTIISNDLGWRAIWFAQCAAIIWTAAWLHDRPHWFRERALSFKLLLILGLAAVIWDIVGLRLIRAPYAPVAGFGTIFTARASDEGERGIYRWAAIHLPAHDVIQHNPVLKRRAFNFGLYGVQRTGVADVEANLFGASPRAVEQRIALVRPIFDTPLPPASIRIRAQAAGIDHLLFASDDPVWGKAGGPPPGLRCNVREPLACLVSVKEIQP